MRNLKGYLRIKQAADFLGVSEETLRNWGRRGKIPTHRHPINRYRLFKRHDLEVLLKKVEHSATTGKALRRERAAPKTGEHGKT